MINTTIGKYKIIRLIGEGGMASVYEAEHEMLGTKVAIKVLNPILSVNTQIKERFRNEAKLMASLDHSNITKIIDFDEQPQQLSIVMEYLNGEDLNQKIKRNGPLSEKLITQIFSQTLSAFQYAHEKGIVHRDIKPSNIFILPNGHVKILDFGIAKLFGQGNEMTQTGTQMGTPIYMSPEQVKADKSIDHRSDIYSLGVTLFYALNGKPPYDNNTTSQYDIFNKIVLEPLPELTGKGYLNELIKKACHKDRNLRFQYCQEWIDALSKKEVSATQTTDNTVVEAPASDKTIVETASAPTADKAVVKTASHDSNKTTVKTQSNPDVKPIIKSGSSAQETPKKSKNNKVLLFSMLGITLFIGGVLFFGANSGAEKTNSEMPESTSEKATPARNFVNDTTNIERNDSLGKIVETQYEETTKHDNQVGKLDSDNLSVTTFRNGDNILQANNFEEWIMAANNKKPAWCYVNFDKNTELKCGKIYNGYAIKDPRGLAPNGKYIPSIKDYELILASEGIKLNKPNSRSVYKFVSRFVNTGGLSVSYHRYDDISKEWVDTKPWAYWFGENSHADSWTRDGGIMIRNDVNYISDIHMNLYEGYPVRCISY